jgi:DNA-nicking Smr family endonuclease
VRDDAETDAALADLVAGAGHFEVDGAEGLAPGVDRRLLKKLRAGDYPVEARLDLHGLTAAEAQAAVTRFVTEARKQKRRAVLVIHGRGLNSEGAPVLKGALGEWLSVGRLARGVLAFSAAQPADGGPGATYVLLRKLTS